MFGLGELFTREVRVPVTVETVEEHDGRKMLLFDNGWVLVCAKSDGNDGGFAMSEIPKAGDALVLGVQAMVYKVAAGESDGSE